MNSKNYNESNYTSADEAIKQAEQELEQKVAKSEEAGLPSFEELGKMFDSRYETACRLLEGLSKNSLIRLIKKDWGYPLRDNEVKLFHKEEQSLFEVSIHLQQLKTNMMLEQIKAVHEEEAKKIKESYDAADEFEKTLEGENGPDTN